MNKKNFKKINFGNKFKFKSIFYYFNKFNYNQFISLGAHIYNFIDSYNNNEAIIFINIIFNKFIFFNLNIVNINFLISLKFIKYISFKYKKFFFIFKKGFQNYIFNKYFNKLQKNNFYIIFKYIPGLISNFNIIKSNTNNFKKKKLITNIKNFFNFVIFFGNFSLVKMISNETKKTKLPNVGFVDVNFSLSPFNYSIITNTNSFLTLFFFFKIICINIYKIYFNKNNYFIKNFINIYKKFKKKRINKRYKKFKFFNFNIFFKNKKKNIKINTFKFFNKKYHYNKFKNYNKKK